jgi:hypothetical protein
MGEDYVPNRTEKLHMRLFPGWLGMTNIVTKLSTQLFPRMNFKDLLIFVTDNIDLVPEFLF